MANNDVMDLEEQINLLANDANRDDLQILIEEIKRNHFPNVLSKSAYYRDKYKGDEKLVKLLILVEAVCHAQIEEYRQSAELIRKLYDEAGDRKGSELVTLGEIAFMSDYKLARRILSDAVKRMDSESESDRIKLARGYLVLGEAEEKLEKFTRAIKYYKQGLEFFQADDIRDQYMILYLHFKIGMLYSARDKLQAAIEYLEKALELADAHLDMKINSLVSLAKIHGSRDDNEKAYPYLKEALDLLENSALADSATHAEALTEMAFYYFDQSKLDEAIPYYKRAISAFKKQRAASARKLGMIYMQYAYCLEHKEKPNKQQAGNNYEKAIEQLEKSNDRELLENALADVIAFFNVTNNNKKKRYYENKFVQLINMNN